MYLLPIVMKWKLKENLQPECHYHSKKHFILVLYRPTILVLLRITKGARKFVPTLERFIIKCYDCFTILQHMTANSCYHIPRIFSRQWWYYSLGEEIIMSVELLNLQSAVASTCRQQNLQLCLLKLLLKFVAYIVSKLSKKYEKTDLKHYLNGFLMNANCQKIKLVN